MPNRWQEILERWMQYCFVRGQGRPLVVTPVIEQFLFEAEELIQRDKRSSAE